MSLVRKHFCTEVARGQGGTSSPRKNGLKGTMPAMVNSTDGSWGMRLAEGTGVWPRSTKNRVNAARRWSASIAVPGVTTSDLSCPGETPILPAAAATGPSGSDGGPATSAAAFAAGVGAGGRSRAGSGWTPWAASSAHSSSSRRSISSRPDETASRTRSPALPATCRADLPTSTTMASGCRRAVVCCQVWRTLRSAHRVDPAPTATPVISQKVRLGISGARRSRCPTDLAGCPAPTRRPAGGCRWRRRPGRPAP